MFKNSITLLCFLGFATGVTAQECATPDISICPSFYIERCQSDETFKDANAGVCLDVILGDTQDDTICKTLTLDGCDAAFTQNEACVVPTLQTCPSLYEEQCRNDEGFRGASQENTVACLAVLTGTAVDEASCSEFDASACTIVDCNNPTLHPLEAFYCRESVPECPLRIPELEGRFTDVLDTLNLKLEPYQSLIELNPESLENTEQLCTYSASDILALQRQATANNREISENTSNLATLKQCNRLTTEFLESPKPENISGALWANIKVTLSEQLELVGDRQGQVDTQIEKLNDAPQKINDLKFVHDFACAGEN